MATCSADGRDGRGPQRKRAAMPLPVAPRPAHDGWPSVVGPSLLGFRTPSPVTDRAAARRIAALLGPLADWGVGMRLVAPGDGPVVSARELVGRVTNQPRERSIARGPGR